VRFGALILLLAATAARADSVADEADFRFHRGAQLFRKGQIEEALSEFLASNHLVHNRNVVFNIARSFQLLERYNEAWRWYNDILAEESLTPEDRKAVQDALKQLQPSLALLRVESDPPGATVYVGRKDLGPRGQAPMVLALAAGKTEVIAELPGYRPASTHAELAVGATRTARLSPQRIYGALAVSGDPEGAEVHLDRLDSPPQPARGKLQVLPGEHLVFLVKQGFNPEELSVRVPPDGVVPIQFRLTPVPPPSGKLVVRASVEGALVRIDGKESGFTPDVIDVPAGWHQLEVIAEGREPRRQIVWVHDGERTFLDLELRYVQQRVMAAERQHTLTEEAPASVSIISAGEILAFGYTTLAQALRSVRGLYTTSDRSYESFGVRGLSPPGVYNDKVLVLSDGHVDNDVTSGQGFIGHDFDVDLSDVERIEVVRGPGSVMYGSAAFVAVVNVVHRAPAENGTHLQAGAALGSLGESSGSLLASTKGASGALTLRGAGLRAEGENVFAAPGDPPQPLAIGLDGEKAGHADLRARSGDFALEAVYNRRNKGIATGPYNTFAQAGTQNDVQRWFVEGSFSHDFGDGLGLDLRALHDGSHTVQDYAISGSNPGKATRDGEWSGGEVRIRLPEFFGGRVYAGSELQRIWRSQLVLQLPGQPEQTELHTQTMLSGYLGDDVRLGRRATLSAAVRYDSYFGDPGVQPDPQINPRLALILNPYDRGTLKLIAGTAYRAPTLNERYFHNDAEGQIAAEGTPAEKGRGAALAHLSPEKVRTAEFELTHHVNDATQIVASGYWSRIDSIIRLKPITYLDSIGVTRTGFRLQNKSALTFSGGLEGEVRWQPRPGALLSFWYAFNQIRNNNENKIVPNAPAHTGALRGMTPLLFERLWFSTELIYNSARYTAADVPGQELLVGEQFLWNLGITGQYPPWRLRYGAFVDNLLDQRVLLPGGLEIPFAQHVVPQVGRTVRVSAGATF
jgi:outer membrane receptor protein involved in Fe transport